MVHTQVTQSRSLSVRYNNASLLESRVSGWILDSRASVTGYLSRLLMPCMFQVPIKLSLAIRARHLSSGWISPCNVVQHRFSLSQGVLEGAVSNGYLMIYHISNCQDGMYLSFVIRRWISWQGLSYEGRGFTRGAQKSVQGLLVSTCM